MVIRVIASPGEDTVDQFRDVATSLNVSRSFGIQVFLPDRGHRSALVDHAWPDNAPVRVELALPGLRTDHDGHGGTTKFGVVKVLSVVVIDPGCPIADVEPLSLDSQVMCVADTGWAATVPSSNFILSGSEDFQRVMSSGWAALIEAGMMAYSM